MSILALAERAAEVDGVEPFNEASLFALRDGSPPDARAADRGRRHDLRSGLRRRGCTGRDVVDPAHRRAGKGRRILDELMADGEDRFWAHGDLPAARPCPLRRTERRAHPARAAPDVRRPPEPERVPDGIAIRSYAPAMPTRSSRSTRARPPITLTRCDGRCGLCPAYVGRWFDPAGPSSPSGTAGSSASTGPRSGRRRRGLRRRHRPDAQGGGLGTALTARGLRHMYERACRSSTSTSRATTPPPQGLPQPRLRGLEEGRPLRPRPLTGHFRRWHRAGSGHFQPSGGSIRPVTGHFLPEPADPKLTRQRANSDPSAGQK